MRTKINRGLENKSYVIIVSIVTVCFFTFLTSKIWMYDDSNILQSPFNKSITGLDQTTLVLNKWEYNPTQQLMEVSIETKHTGTDLINPTFKFKAKEKGVNKNYPVRVVYDDGNNMVLQIKKVPQKYKNVALIVEENRDEVLLMSEEFKNDLKNEDTLIGSDNDKNDLKVKPSTKVLIGDYRKVKENKELTIQGDFDYRKEQIVRDMNRIETKITKIEKDQIPLQNEIIRSVKNEIKLLKSDLKYQTKEEKNKTNEKIQSRLNNIKSINEQIGIYKELILTLDEKHKKLNEKLNDVKELYKDIDTNKEGNTANSK